MRFSRSQVSWAYCSCFRLCFGILRCVLAMPSSLGPCKLCSQPWLQPCDRCQASNLESWFNKFLEPKTALQLNSSVILWYVLPHPLTGCRPYNREIRDASLVSLLSGAAHSHNIWWDTRERMQKDITSGRQWQDRWYRTSCKIKFDEDLFTLIFAFLP